MVQFVGKGEDSAVRIDAREAKRETGTPAAFEAGSSLWGEGVPGAEGEDRRAKGDGYRWRSWLGVRDGGFGGRGIRCSLGV